MRRTSYLKRRRVCAEFDGVAHVNALAETLSKTLLTDISAREGDFYDLFVEAPGPEQGPIG